MIQIVQKMSKFESIRFEKCKRTLSIASLEHIFKNTTRHMNSNMNNTKQKKTKFFSQH